MSSLDDLARVVDDSAACNVCQLVGAQDDHDLARVVDDSAACNVCQLVGAQDGRVLIPTRDWAGFLSSYFRRLDGIKQYHHFHFERDHPGAVFLRKTAVTEEEERKLLRVAWRPSVVDKPPSITPQGLSYERRKYLYKKIREYCRDDVRDIICPDPDSPVPVTRSSGHQVC